MSGDIERERFLRRMNQDFFPQNARGSSPSAGMRIADAAKYTAYHLGQINKKLDRLIAALEMIARKP